MLTWLGSQNSGSTQTQSPPHCQWGNAVRIFTPHFNVYVRDLVFIRDSDHNWARAVSPVMAANSVQKLSLVGLSYGGIVGYCLAARNWVLVERVVICSRGLYGREGPEGRVVENLGLGGGS
ncbi:Abhydrolase_6 domain-containing protein [Cucumis melo var. makuwa]|uniref:Abhydrolase_6 domain-containing protein n=2 Tax=Cucumis melo TaxID=3656 RepID=A0A5A7T775_CUCMM|nr:Abhydrolase_6 domain-containing protein [Cucumis melo var. makuwa]TYK31320.1 Abhydrolase_6 domain-containing protein [Cucumis melo var. makuwa]